MSRVLSNQYYSNLDRAIQFGKSTNEQRLRNQFWLLLDEYTRMHNCEVNPEVFCLGSKKRKVYADGIVQNSFGLDTWVLDSKGKIDTIDDQTNLTGIPKEAWEYKLGDHSVFEWILDQYKEKKPFDPSITEKFNTYRFADYKEQVIDLLKQVCTVSVETMKIIRETEKE